MNIRVSKLFLACTIIFLMAGCATSRVRAVKSTLEYGSKIITSETQLTDSDMYINDFFVESIFNHEYNDFNKIIFSYIKEHYLLDAKYDFVSYGSDNPKPSYKEAMILSELKSDAASKEPPESNSYEIVYIIAGKYGFNRYHFGLLVDAVDYGRDFKKQLDVIQADKNLDLQLQNNISSYQWTIDNCSSPTIRKSRTVSVPKQVKKRVYHEPVTSNYGIHNGGPQVIQEGYWEDWTETVYEKETQYYDEANPNYNPQAVANAKSKLPKDQQKKQELGAKIAKEKAKLGELLPFTVFYYEKQ